MNLSDLETLVKRMREEANRTGDANPSVYFDSDIRGMTYQTVDPSYSMERLSNFRVTEKPEKSPVELGDFVLYLAQVRS